jgi:iron-sulfur cluster repair protein YtfE (RIC family)
VLLPHVETLVRVADAVGMAPLESLLRGIDEVYDFLSGHLIPHALAEDSALYPYIGEVLGAPEATATMSRDHLEISKLVEQLADLRSQLATEPLNAFRANELRRLLYGLYALVKLHFAKEEEVYFPLLDTRGMREEMHRVLEAMGKSSPKSEVRT